MMTIIEKIGRVIKSCLDFLFSLSTWEICLIFVFVFGCYLLLEYSIYKLEVKIKKEEEDRINKLPIDKRILIKLNKIISKDASDVLYSCSSSKDNKELELNLNLSINYRADEEVITGFKTLESICLLEKICMDNKIIEVLKALNELDEKFELYKINFLVGVLDDYGYASARVLHSFILTSEDLDKFNWNSVELYNFENVNNKNKEKGCNAYV